MTARAAELREQALRELVAAEVSSLEAHGYRHVAATRGGIVVGQRVRHSGQQYPEAYRGTATVHAVMQAGPTDVELVVLRDAPMMPGGSRVSSWADYHTRAVRP